MNPSNPNNIKDGISALDTSNIQALCSVDNPNTAEDVARKMIQTERIFIQSVLRPILNVFMPRLRQSMRPQDFMNAFGDIEAIARVHEEMLATMESAFEEESVSELAIAFSRTVQYLKVYADYYANQELSEQTLQRLFKKDKNVRLVLMREEDVLRVKLSEILYLLKFRIFHYSLFFEAMLGRVHPLSDESMHIQFAANKAQESILCIAGSVDDTRSRKQVVQLQTEFFHDSVDIIEHFRQLLRDGVLKQRQFNSFFHRKGNVRLLLFNDIMIVSSLRGKVYRVVLLKTTRLVITGFLDITMDTERGRLCFEAHDAQERDGWRLAIMEAIGKAHGLCLKRISEEQFEQMILKKREKIEIIDVDLQKRMLNAEKSKMASNPQTPM